MIAESAFQRLHAVVEFSVAAFDGREFGSQAFRCDPVGRRSSTTGLHVDACCQVFVALQEVPVNTSTRDDGSSGDVPILHQYGPQAVKRFCGCGWRAGIVVQPFFDLARD
ncbi:hypothetical protein [Mycolicibacterium goodii]|uniref:Uncharacterized protein n=1 Tax=Mycolicibacterium goodii TaxID=134601 RepID=A0ABS6I1V3_MYCGD|nr:hypothetical protein [Mycolicibacterium goodii]MBU8814332.1 hypothetical protein [Mycolicibacterium goodii]MBU8827735.1 hypothetical protein [Mycolicibacterium goodii]MBU8841688.1 hypothetical protein [Mycolicibacterium goodii]